MIISQKYNFLLYKKEKAFCVNWVLTVNWLYCFIIPIARLNHDRIRTPSLSAPVAGRTPDADTVWDRLYPASALGGVYSVVSGDANHPASLSGDVPAAAK